MSIQRSPTQLPRSSIPASLSAFTQAGGSEPDLSKISNQYYSDSQITVRKRKQPEPCECARDVKQIQAELSRMNSLLERYVTSNEQNMKILQNSVNEIKLQVTSIEATTSAVLDEQKLIKSDISKLEESVLQNEKKIKSIESDITSIKKSSPGTSFDHHAQLKYGEKTIQELNNRRNREKNVILVGVPETGSLTADEAEVMRIASSLSTKICKPCKVFRIGKSNVTGKHRSVKVCFDDPASAKELFRNKNKLPDNIKIYNDQTPSQQNYLKSLKEELKRREDTGETELTIKYLNGTPTIIKAPTKNYNRHTQKTSQNAQTPMKY